MKKVCLVYDIGRTNKKVYLFDEELSIVDEKSIKIPQIIDEDGDACEDLAALSVWIISNFHQYKNDTNFELVAVNCSAFAASWVHLDKDKKVISPLYNSSKSFPYKLKQAFNDEHNKDNQLFIDTASPQMGMLNAGLQLYWLKKEKTELFKKVKYSLPLAQYCLFLLHDQVKVGLTSIGCHSALWNFDTNDYHNWVKAEKLDRLLSPPCNSAETIEKDGIIFGVGIHNSSAALVPYLKTHKEPFILLSTGVWTITFNPFCEDKVDNKHLQKDALNYFRYDGKTVRGSRLFSGDEHKRVAKILAEHFKKDLRHYRSVSFDPKIVTNLRKKHTQFRPENTGLGSFLDCPFMDRSINDFDSYEKAYHQFMMDLVAQQISSIKLTFGKQIPRYVFVDGGFAENEIFLNLLNEAFFDKKLYANNAGQASALGAAMVIENAWHPKKLKIADLSLVAY